MKFSLVIAYAGWWLKIIFVWNLLTMFLGSVALTQKALTLINVEPTALKRGFY
jgi:hypothetical protein